MTTLLAAGLLTACEAELLPAFEDAPVFELLDSELDGPVLVILHAPGDEPLLLGGARGGPPLLARGLGADPAPLPTPRSDQSPVGADLSGRAVWAVGPGFAWDGPPEALGERPLPRADLELIDVSARPGGGLVAAVGPRAFAVFRPGDPPRLVPLSTTASAGLSAVHVAADGRAFLGAESGLLGSWSPPEGPLRPIEGLDAVVRALDGANGRLYAAGGRDAGVVAAVVNDRIEDISVGGMPPLDHVASEADVVWVASREGFIARFDGQLWRAFEIPLGARSLDALAVQGPDAVWLGGGDAGGGGWWGRFRTSRLVE